MLGLLNCAATTIKLLELRTNMKIMLDWVRYVGRIIERFLFIPGIWWVKNHLSQYRGSWWIFRLRKFHRNHFICDIVIHKSTNTLMVVRSHGGWKLTKVWHCVDGIWKRRRWKKEKHANQTTVYYYFTPWIKQLAENFKLCTIWLDCISCERIHRVDVDRTNDSIFFHRNRRSNWLLLPISFSFIRSIIRVATFLGRLCKM